MFSTFMLCRYVLPILIICNARNVYVIQLYGDYFRQPVQRDIMERPDIQSKMSLFVRLSTSSPFDDSFLLIFRSVVLRSSSRGQGSVLVCNSICVDFLFFHFGTALAIIAEHAFYLWDRAASDDASLFISAIDAYNSSAKHTAVTQAIDEVFAEDGGRLFDDAKDSEDPTESTFAERLAQIALDNRLCTCHLVHTMLRIQLLPF